MEASSSRVNRPRHQHDKSLVCQALQRTVHSPGQRLKQAATTPAVKSLQHLKTIRGHHSPVYCLAVDKAGLLAVTGADDSFVKVPFDT